MTTHYLSTLANLNKIPTLPTLHTEQDLQKALKGLQQTLSEFDEEYSVLNNILDASAKHLPAYLKVVKGHLEQLSTVLSLDSHDKHTLDYCELAEPLQQVVQLFQHLTESDVTLFESLAQQTQYWQQAALAPTTVHHSMPITEKVL